MSEAKHTKGPWKIVQGGDEECIYIEQATYDANGRGAVATVFTVHAKPTETELADAHLIVAAPDLLDACKRLLDAPHYEHFAVRLNDEEMTALDGIKAAIAKAVGAA